MIIVPKNDFINGVKIAGNKKAGRKGLKIFLGVVVVIALFAISFIIAYMKMSAPAPSAKADDLTTMTKDELITKAKSLNDEINQKDQQITDLTAQVEKYKSIMPSSTSQKDTSSASYQTQAPTKQTEVPAIKKPTASPSPSSTAADTATPVTTDTPKDDRSVQNQTNGATPAQTDGAVQTPSDSSSATPNGTVSPTGN